MTDKEEGQVVVGDAAEEPGEPAPERDEAGDAGPPAGTGEEDVATEAAEADEAPDEAEVPDTSDPVEVLEEEVADLTDRLARALAEQDNLQKRADRRVEQARTAGKQGLLFELLPVLEDLDRALSDDDPDPAALGMVRDELWRVLGRLGLSPIDADGEAFDPDLHEAVARVATDDRPAGTVVDVVQRGYTLDDRVLRPSKVTVARAPDDAKRDDDGTEADHDHDEDHDEEE